MSVTTVPPSTPTALAAASGVTANRLIANWSAATNAIGYRLDVSTNATFSSYWGAYQDMDVGNILNRVVSNLSSNLIYYYRVRAYNANGTSGNSGTILVTTIAPTCTTGILLNASFEGTTNSSGVATNWIGYQRAPNPVLTVWSIKTSSPPPGAGLQYQQIANTNSAGGAGVRQDITGCTIGESYSVSGWMRGNSSSYSTCRVRVSPTASTDWSTAVDLSPAQVYTGDSWEAFSGTVAATGTNMTLWLDGQTTGSAQDKAECFDGVSVSCVGQPNPPAAPTALAASGVTSNALTANWSSLPGRRVICWMFQRM